MDEKKRKRDDIVYSQPAVTGAGHQIMTQITYAIEYLKSKDHPRTFDQILSHLSLPNASAQDRRLMQTILRSNPKVHFDGKAYTFKPPHNVRSAAELERYLQSRTNAQGVKVTELKEGWSGAFAAIAQLESERKILVTRNKKDNTAKMVWYNDSSLPVPKIDDEFRIMWLKATLPPTDAELWTELERAGLTPTSQVKEVSKAVDKKDKKKKTRRGGKVTNTHMAGILRDYSSLKK